MLWHPKTQKVLKIVWFVVAIFLILGMVLIYIPF